MLLDANELVAPGTDGAAVTNWDDSTGNVALIQAAGAYYQPTYDEVDEEANGQASMYFNDAQQQDLRDLAVSFSDAAYTIFYVAKFHRSAQNDWMLSLATGSLSSDDELSFYKTAGNVINFRCDNGTGVCAEQSDLDDQFHVYSVTVEDGAQKIWRDGSNAWSANDTASLTLGTISRMVVSKLANMTSGGAQDIGYALVYAGVLSDASREAVEQYLIRRYLNEHFNTSGVADPTGGDLFLVLGQSNASGGENVGGGKGKQSPRLEHPSVATWHEASGEWVRANADTGGDTDGGVGQWFGRFARKALDDSDATAIGHIGKPVGGQSVVYFKDGHASGNYSDVEAMVTASGISTANLTIIIWVGETDSIAAMSEAVFRGHLDDLRASLRASYGTSISIIVFVNAVGYSANINAAYASFASDNADVTAVDLASVTGSLDSLHYPYNPSAGGYKTVGELVHAAVYP